MWEITPNESTGRGVPGFLVSDGERKFAAHSKEDAEWLVTALDEVTNTVVRLYCQNKPCKGFGGYITRTASEAKKSMFTCDDCGKPMTRRAVEPEGQQAEPNTREKQPTKRETVMVPDQPVVSGQIPATMRMPAAASRTQATPVMMAPSTNAAAAVAVSPNFVEALMARLVGMEAKSAELEARLATLEAEFGAMGESFQSTLQMLDSLVSAQKA